MLEHKNDNLMPNHLCLKFADITKEVFGFLDDLAFLQIEALPTIVHYRKGDIDVNVYQGRQSYELGFEVVRHGLTYSISEIIRVNNPSVEKDYRSYVAITETATREGLILLSELVKQYGGKALCNDPEFFVSLENQRKSWSKNYALDVLEFQLRPKAQEAFWLGNYREAAKFYEQIYSRLTPLELKKLAFAQKKQDDAL